MEASSQSRPPIGSSHHQRGNQGLTDTVEPLPRMNCDNVRKVILCMKLNFIYIFIEIFYTYTVYILFYIRIKMLYSCLVVLYQFLQSVMMLSPGFANCPSDSPGHTNDVLLESGLLTVIPTSETKMYRLDSSLLSPSQFNYSVTTSIDTFHINR